MVKKQRKIKVYEASVVRDRGYKFIPQIRLQGEWLRQLGFEPGVEMKVECRDGELVLRRK